MSYHDVSDNWPLSLLKSSPKKTPVPTEEPEASEVSGYGATPSAARDGLVSQRSFAESVHDAWQKTIFPSLPKLVDNLMACMGKDEGE